jgi:glutamine amidotransferase PdxT
MTFLSCIGLVNAQKSDKNILDRSSEASILGSCSGIMYSQAIRDVGTNSTMFTKLSDRYQRNAHDRYAKSQRFTEYDISQNSRERAMSIGERIDLDSLRNAVVACKKILD